MTITQSLSDLGQEAGAGAYVMDYLLARGIKTMGTLALIATSPEQLQTTLVAPLLAGFTKGSVTINLQDDEKPIAAAVILQMWQEARLRWNTRQTSVAAPAAPNPSGPSAPASASTGGDRAPKILPPQVWSDQVSRYNRITLDGKPRKFPEMELLGAEQVLARIHWEHTQSKQYTPVGLGEILQKRSFQASGEVNPLQKDTAKSKALTLENDVLVQEEDKVWQPRSVLSVMDGINSVRWAFILLQIGEEEQVHEYADWFIRKARARPQKLEQLRLFWDGAGWKIAMAMRSGRTFGEASKEIMSDVDMLIEYLSKEVVTKDNTSNKQPPSKKRGPPADEKDERLPTRPKGGQKGGGKPPQRPRQEQTSWSSHSSGWSGWDKSWGDWRYNQWKDKSSRSGDKAVP